MAATAAAYLRPTGSRRGVVIMTLAWLVVPVTAAVMPLVMYRFGAVAGIALPFAAAAAALIALRPIYGIYASLLTIPVGVYVTAGNRSYAELVLLFTAVMALVHLVGGVRRPLSKPHLAFMVLVLMVLTGLLVAQDVSPVIRTARAWAAYAILSIYLSREGSREIRRFLTLLIVVGGFIGVAAILKTGQQQVLAQGEIIQGRTQIGFGGPNVLGSFLLLVFPIAVVVAMRTGAPWRRWLAAVTSAVVLGGILVSLSRSAMLGALAALLVLLAWRDIRRLVLVVIILLAGVAAVHPSTLSGSKEVSVVRSRLSTLSRSQANATDPRLLIWRTTPAIIADHYALGIGTGNFPKISPLYGLRNTDGLPFEHAHDNFLTFAVELGVIGLGIFLVWIGTLIGTAREALRRAGPDWSLVLAVIAALTGFFLTGIIDFTFRNNIIVATVLLLVGVLVHYAQRSVDGNTAV